MTRMTKLAALAPALLLGGCLSFGGEAPDSLLTLTPAATAPAGESAASDRGTALAIVPFEATKALDVTRVPVQVTDTELAYLQDAFWVDRPARLFGQLVAETIRSQNGRVVVDGDDPGRWWCSTRCAMVRAQAQSAAASRRACPLPHPRPNSSARRSTRRPTRSPEKLPTG